MQEIIQRTANGNNVISLETANLEKRFVHVQGKIEHECAFEFALAMHHLNCISEKPITVLINSPGGSVDAGLLMYDVIQASPAPVKVVVLGSASSMAAVLFATGQHGRFLLPNSKLMLHEPLLGCPIGGNTTSIKTISDNLLATRDKINNILAKHTGKTMQEIEEVTRQEHYFTAAESVEFGLADRVISFAELVNNELK